MKRLRLQWSRLWKFSFVGLAGAGLQLISAYLLTKYAHLRGVLAAPLAVEIAVLHNFIWHQRFTWRDRNTNGRPQQLVRLWRFQFGNGLISIFGNTLLIYCFVERLNAPILPATMAAIALCSLLNFLLADRWVYGN